MRMCRVVVLNHCPPYSLLMFLLSASGCSGSGCAGPFLVFCPRFSSSCDGGRFSTAAASSTCSCCWARAGENLTLRRAVGLASVTRLRSDGLAGDRNGEAVVAMLFRLALACVSCCAHC
uniref:Secreted protein n=1 Tax=Leersia perrieri TaxID=77586 RepID=A0A0D9W7N7_9ORYZ